MVKRVKRPWSTSARVAAGGETYWYFIPPKDARSSGLLQSRNLGDDTKQAIALAEQYRDAYDRWKRGEAVDPIVTPRGSWREAADYYQQSPAYLVGLADSTRAGYASGLKALMAEPAPWRPEQTIGQTKVEDMTESRAADLYRQLQRLKRVDDKIKPTRLSMANLCMAVASVVWQTARGKGYVSGDNPIALVRQNRVANSRQLWTYEDVKRYVMVGWDRETFWRGRMYPVRSVALAVALQFDLWQRQGDILDLKWEDWDGKHFRIVPNKTESTVGKVVNPKPSMWTTSLLMIHRANTPYHKPSDYIITNERTGTRYAGPGSLRKIHVNILREAGLPLDLTLLDLRRSGINEGIDAGVDAIQAIAQSGHADIRTLARHYRQPSKQQAANVRDKVDAYRGRGK